MFVLGFVTSYCVEFAPCLRAWQASMDKFALIICTHNANRMISILSKLVEVLYVNGFSPKVTEKLAGWLVNETPSDEYGQVFGSFAQHLSSPVVHMFIHVYVWETGNIAAIKLRSGTLSVSP